MDSNTNSIEKIHQNGTARVGSPLHVRFDEFSDLTTQTKIFTKSTRMDSRISSNTSPPNQRIHQKKSSRTHFKNLSNRDETFKRFDKFSDHLTQTENFTKIGSGQIDSTFQPEFTQSKNKFDRAQLPSLENFLQ